MPQITAIATSVPGEPVPQEEVRQFVRDLFEADFPAIDRYLTIFESTGIDQRHLAEPWEWFQQPQTFGSQNDRYLHHALALAQESVEDLLDQAELDGAEVDALFMVSSTGVSTPSLGAHLMNAMDLNQNLQRFPLWGLGCAGGAAGLARAYHYALAHPDQRVVLVAVELCSLTFQYRDRSKRNLVATSLFADGAAALLLEGDEVAGSAPGPALQVQDCHSTLWADTLDLMGWDVDEHGLSVVFSTRIPRLAREELAGNVDDFLGHKGLGVQDIDHWVIHPGGTKVIAAYEEALELPASALATAREVMRRYGNMSSPTVLFVLDQLLNTQEPKAGERGLLAALGPGFSSEQLLLEWV